MSVYTCMYNMYVCVYVCMYRIAGKFIELETLMILASRHENAKI